ncbi:unnamed protein product [Prorocentrum cordatum]|uniref:Uncharacterized protein n=1 Tax=Prorocentrum cordatum TaxID=2364126 RepID=A0ABN9WSG3_9DINO|nr:unnamed protein product [Polarella glacialis]
MGRKRQAPQDARAGIQRELREAGAGLAASGLRGHEHRRRCVRGCVGDLTSVYLVSSAGCIGCNALKAVGLANAFARLDDPPTSGLAVVPALVDASDPDVEAPDGDFLRLVRLSVLPLPAPLSASSSAGCPEQDYARGGLYVPAARAGAFRAADRERVAASGPQGSRGRAMAEVYLPQHAQTPTELARVALGRWLRWRREDARGGQNAGPPFLLTRGPEALGRAARALAIACERALDRGLEPLAVEPRLWERPPRPAPGGGAATAQGSRLLVLRLVPAPPRPGSAA